MVQTMKLIWKRKLLLMKPVSFSQFCFGCLKQLVFFSTLLLVLHLQDFFCIHFVFYFDIFSVYFFLFSFMFYSISFISHIIRAWMKIRRQKCRCSHWVAKQTVCGSNMRSICWKTGAWLNSMKMFRLILRVKGDFKW